jgi:hypothetical protein
MTKLAAGEPMWYAELLSLSSLVLRPKIRKHKIAELISRIVGAETASSDPPD